MNRALHMASAKRRAGAPDVLAHPTTPFQKLGGFSIRFDWVMRVVFGLALAAGAIAAIAAGSYYFVAVTAVLGVAAIREWYRMVGGEKYAREIVIASAATVAALAAVLMAPDSLYAWIILAGGAILAFFSAAFRGTNAFWQAGGVFYIGVPALALALLRLEPANGAFEILGLMLAVWATDTGALLFGKLFGGSRLAPELSPNKTWSGTLGGIGTAAVTEAIYIGVLKGDAALAAVFGAGIAVAAHAGDLFESWVKRRFRIKDSGGLIPGHGGILDRIDSTLAASTALVIAVYVFGLDPLFGAHP